MIPVLPQVVRVQHDVRADGKLDSEDVPVRRQLVVSGIVEDLVVRIWRATKSSAFDIAFQLQPVSVARGKALPLDEPELAAIPIGNRELPSERIPGGHIENAAVFRGGPRREAGPMPVPAAKSKIPVPVHICFIAQFAPEDGSESGLKVNSKIAVPAMRARIAGG